MIHPGFPRSRSYNPRSVKQITVITTTDLGNIPTSSTLQWGTLGPSLWTNTNTNTNTNTLTAKYLKSMKIPSLKTKKIPGAVPANYSTIIRKNTNYLQTKCLNYVLTTRSLKLQNQQCNHRELVLHRSKWVSAGKRRVSQYIHCFRVVYRYPRYQEWVFWASNTTDAVCVCRDSLDHC